MLDGSQARAACPAQPYGKGLTNLVFDIAKHMGTLEGGTLPAVTFVRGIGYRTEHPGDGTKISDGTTFVSSVISKLQASPYAHDVLTLVVHDEGGGYFDPVAPAAASRPTSEPSSARLSRPSPSASSSR